MAEPQNQATRSAVRSDLSGSIEAKETLAEEFARLVQAFETGERQSRGEAWNLIADFVVGNFGTIYTALRSHDGMLAALIEARNQLPGEHYNSLQVNEAIAKAEGR